jgi:hypothetical protein
MQARTKQVEPTCRLYMPIEEKDGVGRIPS